MNCFCISVFCFLLLLSSAFTAFARTYCVDSNGVPLDDAVLDAEEEEMMKRETGGKGKKGGKGKNKSSKTSKSGGESKSSGKKR